jgi:hypothetical protein
MSTPNTRRFAVAAALLFGLAACSEAPLAPSAAASGGLYATAEDGTPEEVVPIGTVKSISDIINDPTTWTRTVWACKVGTNATVAVSVDGSTAVNQPIAIGTCRAVHVNMGTEFEVDEVTVSEVLNAQVVLDSMIVLTTRFQKITTTTKYTDTNTGIVITTRAGKGGIITYYNSPVAPPPPTVLQGCTPGYWKQKHHYDSWKGYSPNQLFSSVFENAFPGKTLGQVLQLQGGGLNALGRHTVAALLNSSNPGVNYGMTTAEVIAAFNAAYPASSYNHRFGNSVGDSFTTIDSFSSSRGNNSNNDRDDDKNRGWDNDRDHDKKGGWDNDRDHGRGWEKDRDHHKKCKKNHGNDNGGQYNDKYEQLKNRFAKLNEKGCPLN